MKELVERGHLYIAQPPLFRIVDKKTESYIHNEEEMQEFVLGSGVGRVRLLPADGSAPVTGARLKTLIKKMVRIEGILDRFEHEEKAREVIRILAGDPALKEEDFKTEEVLAKVAKRTAMAVGKSVAEASVEPDQEHGRFRMLFSIRQNGRSGTTSVDRDLLRAPLFAEIRSILQQVAAIGEPPYSVAAGEGDGMVQKIEGMPELVALVMAEGKKGLTVQRYKGLGEMNPEQLWETTMNPEKRTLLQVRIEDAVEADEIFTTLMGDQVEPRRDFIYRNALYVKNLDI
jgi:DNA gyrase subunit B